MPTALIEVETTIHRSPRVMQVEGIFDVPPTKQPVAIVAHGEIAVPD